MFDTLFSSIKIGKLELKNRLVVPPMVTCFADGDFKISDRYIAYMTEKARGGWGLIITEAQIISKSGAGFEKNIGLFDDSMIPGEKKLTDSVHDVGGKICAQLIHSGRQSIYFSGNGQTVAPSPIKDYTLQYTPREMTVEEIHQAIKDFGTAAARAKEAGFDAVEIHGANGYLLHEFVSPASNKRTDEYGGSIDGRMKFPLEVVKSVRDSVGPDFPVIYRLSSVEGLANGEGTVLNDSMVVAMMLESAGIDAIHVSVGNYETERYQIAPAAVERAWSSQYTAELKKVVNIPIINAGKYTDPFMAEAMLKAGRCDLVAMGRQSLADPDFPVKAASGNYRNIRHCIGCNIGCLMHLKTGEPIGCTVNPRIGFESHYINTEKADVSKNVVVIGGGIGGMQAAITAAEKGHKVSIYEKSDRLGGQWNVASVPPYKQDLASFAIWEQRRLKELNVSVNLEREMTAAEIIGLGTDEVILATGAVPIMPPFKGIDRPNVYTSIQVLSAQKIVSGKTAVIGGGDIGSETAAFLTSTNQPAVIFEMQPELPAKMEKGVVYFLREYLKNHNVEVYTGAKVLEIKDNSIVYEKDGEIHEYGGFSDVVIAVGQKSYNPLEETLKGKVSLHVIGDAVKSGHGIDSVATGYKAGYEI